jgi:NAD-dependent deacetylase
VTGVPQGVLDLGRRARRVTVLTGAGMSAESGVPTFRDAQTGLWARDDAADLATPEAFDRDPAHVWSWYLWRHCRLAEVEPNAGHHALARWARRAEVRIVTQNVDDLHEQAGSEVLAHLHGSLRDFRCSSCERPYAGPLPAADGLRADVEPPRCAACGGWVRPGVVWFGEPLPADAFDAAVDACRDADLVLSVGTSGLVHPAAVLPDLAAAARVPVVEVNPSVTEHSWGATHVWRTTAAVGLPALVDALEA